MSLFRNLLFGFTFLALAASGCGEPKTVWGKGRLLYKGQPLTKAVDTRGVKTYFYLGRPMGTKPPDISVTFMPKGAEKTKYECDFDASDSSFKAGFQGKGLPPGEYRISVKQNVPTSKQAVEMNNKFDGDGSPIFRELKADSEAPIDLDLANPDAAPSS